MEGNYKEEIRGGQDFLLSRKAFFRTLTDSNRSALDFSHSTKREKKAVVFRMIVRASSTVRGVLLRGCQISIVCLTKFELKTGSFIIGP